MTREQKINWLENATNEKVIEQLKWAVLGMRHGDITTQIESQEDYNICEAEILKRMSK